MTGARGAATAPDTGTTASQRGIRRHNANANAKQLCGTRTTPADLPWTTRAERQFQQPGCTAQEAPP